MCGKISDSLFTARIEGVVMEVCEPCSRHGEILKRPEVKAAARLPARGMPWQQSPKELVLMIRDDLGEIIKKEREKRDLKQEELAKMLAERESVIHKLESGTFEPSLELARKLEKFFKIKLIEQHEEEHTKQPATADSGPTIGDFVKIKKR